MQQSDLEILNYNTEYLDAIDGSVTDIVPTTVPAAYPAQTRIIPNSVVLPQRSDAGTPAGALANVLQAVMTTQPTNSQQDAYAIQHMQAMSEKSSPMERNRAKLISYGGWAVIAGVVAVGLSQAGLDSVMAWIIFVGVFGFGVYKTNADENRHSPAGVELDKTANYTKIRLNEISAQDKAHERNHQTFRMVVKQVYGANHAQDRNPPQR